MNSLNKAQIIGNLTRDPELKTTNSGQSVCTVGVATNRRWKDSNGERHEEPEYHNVVCWGRLAEIASEYLNKGAKVFFEGRLQTRSWDDDAGVKHFRTEIIADDMIMLSPKDGNGSDGYSAGGATASAAPTPSNDDISAEDLPF